MVKVLGAVLLVVCAGCRVPPKVEVPPPLAVRVFHYSGSPLSGPTDQPMVEQPPQDVPGVRVTVIAMDSPVPGTGALLGSQARLVVSPQAGDAVQPAGSLTQDVRILEGPAASKAWGGVAGGRIPLSLQGVLPSGVTAAFELDDLAPLQDPATGRAARRGLVLALARSTGDGADKGLLASLTVDDLVRPALHAGGTSSASSVLESESALFDVQRTGGGAVFALFVPFRPTGADTQTVGILVQVSPGTADAAHLAAIARCKSDVQHSQAGLKKGTYPAPAAHTGAVTESTALALTKLPSHRRAALVFLADQTGASLSRDLTLTADDGLLDRLAAAVRAKVPADVGDHAAAGWRMEQATMATVVRMAAAGSLPPEVTAVLTSHYGEAGRQPASLEELSRQMGSREDFEAAVVAENRILLEDYSPGARVRAYEWLQARGQAPAGYDPLGTPRERRAALDRAQAASAPTPSAGGRP